MTKRQWKDFLSDRDRRRELVLSLILLVLTLTVLTRFLIFVEHRPGVVLDDPLLRQFKPIDLTWLTFSLIYGSIIGGILTLLPQPGRLTFALQLYLMMVLSRMLVMYLLPLDPPAQLILLRDPVVEFFGSGQTLTRDLFFSGHTSTLFILFLVAEGTLRRLVFLLLTLVVATTLLLQHAHYTVDVVAAFFFCYANFALLCRLRREPGASDRVGPLAASG